MIGYQKLERRYHLLPCPPAPLPHPPCQEQQSKEAVGIKHLCLGPRELSAWNWTFDLNSLLPGLCVSQMRAPPLCWTSKKKWPVLGSDYRDALSARVCSAQWPEEVGRVSPCVYRGQPHLFSSNKTAQKANRTDMTMSDPQDVVVLPFQRSFAFFRLLRPDSGLVVTMVWWAGGDREQPSSVPVVLSLGLFNVNRAEWKS